MKKIICLLFFFVSMFLFSCGHNIQNNAKGIGLQFSWSGQSYVPNIRLGYYDVSTGVVRGNTAYTTTTSTGGSVFGNGGTQTTTQMLTRIQLNEGNLKDVLTSSNSNDEVKKEIIKAIVSTTNPVPIPISAKTVSAAGGSGENSKDIQSISSGIDKLMQSAGDVARDVANNAINQAIKYLIIISICLLFAIAVCVAIYLFLRKKFGKKAVVQTVIDVVK